MDFESASMVGHGVILTDAAAAKAKSLLDQEGRNDLALRIAIQPSGFWAVGGMLSDSERMYVLVSVLVV